MITGIDAMTDELVRLLEMKQKICERINEKKTDIRLYYEMFGKSKDDIDSIMSDYEE